MISYKQNATKDDKLFLKVAKRVLRGDFDAVVSEARESMTGAYNAEKCQLKKTNAAMRAANLVILDALKEYDSTNWRELLGSNEPIKRKAKQVAGSGVTPRAKKWDGASILDMASKNKASKS